MRLLLLGGTSEARQLAGRLADDARFDVTLSLAGRTVTPIAVPVATRVGGFGGARGLGRWIKDNGIDAVIDATHPFAGEISKNAVAACRDCGVALGSLVRAPWKQIAGDSWVEVANMRDAATAIGSEKRNVFLSVGRLEIDAFAGGPQHSYLARTIDPPGDIKLPTDISIVFGRGPFAVEDEVVLLQENAIDVVVSKNSGGALTYGKIEAARVLKLPVIMVARPVKPTGVVLDGVDAAVRWLEGDAICHGDRASGSARGVSTQGS